ncbi:MAG: riboflavin biosynthesis protein RibF [Acidobacteriota bacterium]
MEKRSGNAVTIGNFDGFHLGHQSIIRNTLDIASEFSFGSVLVTFTPNPRKFFGIEDKLIFSDLKKSLILNSTGLKRIEYIDFTKVFDMDGRDFIDKYLLNDFSMRYLVVGENFRLGKGRGWDILKLTEYGKEKNFKVKVVPSEIYKNEKISSSLIRKQLRSGDLSKSEIMLGHSYSIEGVVEKGNRIGTRLGFPTVNIVDSNCLLPDGVYMTKVLLDGHSYKGATYVGTRQVLKKNKRKIETHIFDFNEDVYGSAIKVSFLRFKRKGMIFNVEKELVDQIKKDIESIKFDFKNEVC